MSDASPGYREVNFEYSRNFPGILDHLGLSLAVSTYQAGKVVVLSAPGGQLSVSLLHFDRAMGVAVGRDRIAVATRRELWLLKNAPSIAPQIEPAGSRDACYLTRSAHVTGEIQAHEVAWAGEELWIVNTLFSCLCTLSPEYSFVPRWRPRFISALASEDRCHLNGLAIADGRPRYVTAMAETDTREGWRENKATSGCVIDVPSGQTVARGFAMPHSPRLHDGRLLVLDSGKGQLAHVDTASGSVTPISHLPGYTRGMAVHGPLAFVGLSKIRETSTFGGVPIAEQRESLKCGVGVVELATGRVGALFEFHSGVEEIFDVAILPARSPVLQGPNAGEDEQAPIWLVPEEARIG